MKAKAFRNAVLDLHLQHPVSTTYKPPNITQLLGEVNLLPTPQLSPSSVQYEPCSYHLLLWTLIHAASESEEEQEQSEFVVRLAVLMNKMGIVSWEEMLAVAKGVL